MYRISPSVRSTHNQDGAIVLDIRQGQMFNLNFVGSRILELLKAGTGEAVIVDTICREFDVNQDVVAGDLRDFTTKLETCCLVKREES